VGREEEGCSSNRPELAAFSLVLRDTLIEEPLLYLCDNQSLLKAVNRIGEGREAMLVGAPDLDILAAAIQVLRKRIAAGTSTFLVKVNAHRGELANKRANVFYFRFEGKQGVVPTDESSSLQEEKSCYEAGKLTCEDRHSTFNNSVRDATRRGTAKNEVQTHEERLTGAWRQTSTLRPRFENGVKVMT